MNLIWYRILSLDRFRDQGGFFVVCHLHSLAFTCLRHISAQIMLRLQLTTDKSRYIDTHIR